MFVHSRTICHNHIEYGIESCSGEITSSSSGTISICSSISSSRDGLPEEYDIITTFDVVHDITNPRRALHAIRQAIQPNGTYLMLELNCKDKLEII